VVTNKKCVPSLDSILKIIESGNAERLRQLLATNPLLASNPRLLHRAAKVNAECCIALLEAGADTEAMDSFWGSSALTSAAATGRVDTVRLLLDRGALVDGPLFARNAALIYAAASGKIEVAKLLCESGADVDRDSLDYPHSALNVAEELAPLSNKGQGLVAEYLRSVGATKPWDYHRHEDFWDGAVGELTILFVESCLGNVCAVPLVDSKSEHTRIVVRRTRHGWKKNFQTVFTCGLPLQGAPCEVGLCLTSKWPLHRRAMENEQFARPAVFLGAVADRLLAGAELHHGDVLDRDHPLVAELAWPGEFNQWLVVQHQSFEERRREIADPDLPVILFLVPHLEKKPLKAGADARAKADHKASVKWQKPAASGGKNNIVVPLCYDAPWLGGAWF
jgi:hypothetical protein